MNDSRNRRRLVEFAKTVKQLRFHQKEFFKSPRGSYPRAQHLGASKDLERRIDREIEEILDQPGLFDEPA